MHFLLDDWLQPIICANALCAKRTKWALLRQESKFADWQRVRMQETSKEIPAGSLPRSVDVFLRKSLFLKLSNLVQCYCHLSFFQGFKEHNCISFSASTGSSSRVLLS
uniref:MCM OB domain-containing protein n=1 Tax=Nelumbo nucifera TaxID=4432 RepID=A0A822Z8L2_NELNU|nr:TPA_asm: hypothetical protein HUJ06_008489 [Nelumbo nucifera]